MKISNNQPSLPTETEYFNQIIINLHYYKTSGGRRLFTLFNEIKVKTRRNKDLLNKVTQRRREQRQLKGKLRLKIKNGENISIVFAIHQSDLLMCSLSSSFGLTR